MDERDGTIFSVAQGGASGELIDKETGNKLPFDNPALITIKKDDEVIYVAITVYPPNGQEKTVNVIRLVRLP